MAASPPRRSPRSRPPASTPSQHGDPRVVGWLREWVQEGDLINRQDPSYDLIGRAQDYIVGHQLSPEQCKLKYLPQVTINETRKAMQAHVSAITDLKPVAGWKTNPEYQVQANMLNQYLMARVGHHDDGPRPGGHASSTRSPAGTGDMVVDWDPHAPHGRRAPAHRARPARHAPAPPVLRPLARSSGKASASAKSTR